MRRILITVCLVLITAAPAQAVDFLGVELCVGSVDTSVALPVDSPLTLESAEIGKNGSLVLLLTAGKGRVMDHIDDLMESFTGVAGTGSESELQWSGNTITAYARLMTKGQAGLIVSTSDNCRAAEPIGESAAAGAVATETAPETPIGTPAQSEPEAVAGPVVAGAAAATADSEPSTPDFALKGRFKHSAAEADWVDVMGVVVNNSGAGYIVASFDLSLYDAAGDLICVDTISVNHLKDGQERAFRASIRCPDYEEALVESWKLQFAGGH